MRRNKRRNKRRGVRERVERTRGERREGSERKGHTIFVVEVDITTQVADDPTNERPEERGANVAAHFTLLHHNRAHLRPISRSYFYLL